MTIAQLEKRLQTLEKVVEDLQGKLANGSHERHWWHEDAGRFANDPVFDEIVGLGRKYRESLHPDRHAKKATKKRKNVDS